MDLDPICQAARAWETSKRRLEREGESPELELEIARAQTQLQGAVADYRLELSKLSSAVDDARLPLKWRLLCLLCVDPHLNRAAAAERLWGSREYEALNRLNVCLSDLRKCGLVERAGKCEFRPLEGAHAKLRSRAGIHA